MLLDQNNRLQSLLHAYGDIDEKKQSQLAMMGMANFLRGGQQQLQGLRPMNLNMGNYYAGPSGVEQGANIFSSLLGGISQGAALGMMPGIAQDQTIARQGTLQEMLPMLLRQNGVQ